jgi:metal-sulfur cluster biosynthetic enzyme
MTGYSQTSEPITFSRACPAVMVPQGEQVTLPAGQSGYITQALGGSFTVFVDGNLFRIRGEDADAIGKEPPAPLSLDAGADDAAVEKLVWQQLRTCYDPEIPVNIVDLGLVYECTIEQMENVATGQAAAGQGVTENAAPAPPASGAPRARRVKVSMTLTAPGCGMGDILVDDVRNKLESIPTVGEADVELTFDPPWNHAMMSEVAKLETGMM